MQAENPEKTDQENEKSNHSSQKSLDSSPDKKFKKVTFPLNSSRRPKSSMITNLFVESGDTYPDRDLIYMKPLNIVLKKILEWYWDTGKTILDVTTGDKMSWHSSLISNQKNLSGEKSWNVIFADMSPDSKAEMLADCRHLPFADNSVDIIYMDMPFMEPQNGVETFGIKTHKTPDRPYYFRQIEQKWIPPEEYFFQTWKEFNRVSRNGLIVKMSERYEKGYEITVMTDMDLAYHNKYNKESQFKRCVRVGYRGKRAGLGAKMIHPQRVLSYYTVYKKDYKQR